VLERCYPIEPATQTRLILIRKLPFQAPFLAQTVQTALRINVDLKSRSISLSVKAKGNQDTAEVMNRMAAESSVSTGTTSPGALLRTKLDQGGDKP
jgi:hypothetical protein